jgi:hypothetical protein
MRHAALVLLALSCFSVCAFTQTADELVARNIQARGGIEKIKAIKNMRMLSRFAAGSFKARQTQDNVRPNLVFETLTFQGMTAIQVYDGTTAWQIQPFGGHKDPEYMGEDDTRDMLLDADFDGPLVDFKEKGNTVEFLGHDVVDGDDALRLRITLKNGDIVYDYLDPDTYLEIRKEIQQFIRGSIRSRVVDLGSYKPVEGVMYPFSLAQGSKDNPGTQNITVDKMEANVTVDPSEFAVPASLKQAPKPASDKK